MEPLVGTFINVVMAKFQLTLVAITTGEVELTLKTMVYWAVKTSYVGR